MDKKLRLGLMIALAVVVVVCLGMWGLRQWDYHRARTDYEDARRLAGVDALPTGEAPASTDAPTGPAGAGPAGTAGPSASPEPVETYNPYRDAFERMDLTLLRELNPDVVGWMMIPGSLISYPVVQGEDNEYYLDHTWSGGKNPVGAIFVEMECAGDFSDFNTIVYGHQCLDGSMFGSLSRYEDPDYYAAHPSVYVRLEGDEWRRYDVFAAYEGSVSGWSYRLRVDDPEDRATLVADALERSVIDGSDVVEAVTGEDGTVPGVLTLSTCTGHGYETRWIVQAVLAEA